MSDNQTFSIAGAKSGFRFIACVFLAIFPVIAGLFARLYFDPHGYADIRDPNYFNISFDALLVAFGILGASAFGKQVIEDQTWKWVVLVFSCLVIFLVSMLLPKFSVIPSDLYIVTVWIPNGFAICNIAIAIGLKR